MVLMNKYKRYYKKYKLSKNNLPRTLVLFNIRLRLALDIQIDFSSKSLEFKNSSILETYTKIIKLTELWNAYEALMQYTKKIGRYGRPKKSKAKIYSDTFLKKIGSLPILKKLMCKLKSDFIEDENFKKDFNKYLIYIEKNDGIGKILKKDILSIRKYLDNKMEISGIEIISLIYIERNLYYHNGEIAKMGMNYNNRKLLLDEYKEYFESHILVLANYILCSEINNNE